jgi:hypothetical protein
MAKALSCVFYQGARQRAHNNILHDKVPLPCTFLTHTWLRPFAMRHGRRTAKKHLTARPFETVADGFAVRLIWRRTTTSEIFAVRPQSGKHDKRNKKMKNK